MKRKIIQFVTDEKFLDSTIDLISLCSEEFDISYYRISDTQTPLKFIVRNMNKVQSITIIEAEYMLRNLHDSTVVIHNITALPLHLYESLNQDNVLVLNTWGFDLYSGFVVNEYLIKKWHMKRLSWLGCYYVLPPIVPISLYHTATTKILDKKPFLQKAKHAIHDWVYYRLFKSDYEKAKSNFEHLINRIDYISTVLPLEYEKLNTCGFVKAKYVKWAYVGTSNPVLPSEMEIQSRGRDILVGNSADANNNHIDVFMKLRRIGDAERKVVVPLSYPLFGSYRDIVLQEGNKLLGSSFCPIKDFMPFKDYNDLVGKCSYAIFFNERQHAIGNISLALMSGLKVFLSETSMAYQHFKNLGLKLYSVQKDLNKRELDSPLSMDDIIHNQSILMRNKGLEEKKKMCLTYLSTISNK